MSPIRPLRTWSRRLTGAAAIVAALYLSIAYEAMPAFWRHYEHQGGLADRPMITQTALGIPGDALNVGLVGQREDLICAMRAAGWRPADAVTWRSSAKIASSVLLRRAYPTAPVSNLFYEGRRQDLAFQEASGLSPSTRHHVRFWQVLAAGDEGAPVWLGAATFDRSVGVSHFTGQVTHHIAPDIDAERDRLAADLAAAGVVKTTYSVSGIGPTLLARNGGGDRYFTDGEIAMLALSAACAKRAEPPLALPAPRAAKASSAFFGWLKGLWRRL
ncbi:MAG: LssY C-terminal domain-containing protein [Hyphomicrobiales bacterium]|nr:LssY C-terminal domain-containing protein [Hyphomicrobiales bacterium]